MRPITATTRFIQEISFLLDKGAQHSVGEIEDQIKNRKILEWIEKEYPQTKGGPDFSLFDANIREFLNERYAAKYKDYRGQEKKRWGIENNGLCLLISWGTEIIREIDDRINKNRL